MPDGQARVASPLPPKLWIACGRQRLGKTVVLNTAIQYFRALGSNIRLWNAGQQNHSHSLSTFYEDALVPTSMTLQGNQAWIEARFEDQVEHRYHAVLDTGGGTTGFSSLVEDVPILAELTQAASTS